MTLFNSLFEEGKNLEDLSTAELKDRIREVNDELGLQPGTPAYLKTTGKKDQLIEAIVEAEELSSTENTGKVTGEGNFTSLSPGQIVVHDGNYRNEVDYYDPGLREAFRNSGYQFLHNLVVAQTGDTNESDEEMYRIVSGNRSWSNWLAVVTEDGLDPADFEIPVNVRTYDGSELERRVSEAIEMGQANELQRSMSPVQLMRWYRDLQTDGRYTQQQIAELHYGKANARNKQAIVSMTLGLERLPSEILDLIHYQYHSLDLAANGQEFLEEYNIPYIIEDNDEVVVVGVSMENAKTMMKLYPRRGSKNEGAGVEAVNEFLMSDEIILDNAVHMTASAFKKDLRNRAVTAGLIEGKVTGLSGDAVDSTGIQPEKKSSKPDYMDHPVTDNEAVSLLGSGSVTLAPNFAEALGEMIWEKEEGAYEACMFLMYNGLLKETT